jgi:hypothetical protein
MVGTGSARRTLRHERQTPRVRRRLKVTLERSTSFTVDVGAGGFCLELLRVLAPGSKVSGTIQVPSAEVPFTGLVAWAKPGDAWLGLRGRMGIAFTGPPLAALCS